MRVLWVLLVLPLAAASPGIQNPTEAVPVTLYLHVDGPQDMAMNPVPPPADFRADHAASAAGWSTCVSTPGQGFTGARHHTHYAYVSPVPATYAGQSVPQAHRGILGDLHLPPQDMMLRFYLSQPALPVSPEVVMRATLREGDDISVDHAAMEAGRVIATAQTDPATLSPLLSGHRHVSHEEGVYEFALPLPLPDGAVVPARESFNLRIDFWMDNPHCVGDDYLMHDTVAVHTSAAHRPRLEFEAERVVRIDRLAAVLEKDEVRFEAILVPVFGSADAIITPDMLRVDGPGALRNLTETRWNGLEAEPFPPPAPRDGRLHGLRSWAIAEGGADGAYTVRLDVATRSGAVATAEVPFEIGRTIVTCSVLPTGEPTCATHGGESKASPAFGVAALAVGALLAARRVRA